MSDDIFTGQINADFNKFADEFMMSLVKPKVPRDAIEQRVVTSRKFGFPPFPFKKPNPVDLPPPPPPPPTCTTNPELFLDFYTIAAGSVLTFPTGSPATYTLTSDLQLFRPSPGVGCSWDGDFIDGVQYVIGLVFYSGIFTILADHQYPIVPATPQNQDTPNATDPTGTYGSGASTIS